MKLIVAAVGLVILCAFPRAEAQYLGPQGQATSVRQLVAEGRDDDPVALAGFIIRRTNHDDDIYEFSDGTAIVLVEISRKRWPPGLRVDASTRVEIVGKYERELLGLTKVKVVRLRLAQ